MVLDGRGSVAKVVGTPCETKGTLDEAPAPPPGAEDDDDRAELMAGKLEAAGVGVVAVGVPALGPVAVGVPALGPVGVTARTGGMMRSSSSQSSSPPMMGVGRAVGLLDAAGVGVVGVPDVVEWSLKAPPGTEKENEDETLRPVGLGWKGTTSVGMSAGRLLDRLEAVPVTLEAVTLGVRPVAVPVLLVKPVAVPVLVLVLVLAETLSVGSHGSTTSPVGRTPVGVTVLEAGVPEAGVLEAGVPEAGVLEAGVLEAVEDTRPTPGGEVTVSKMGVPLD